MIWKQKSRGLWLKEGDRNTKFFHLSTIIQHRHNNIDAIKNEEGTWVAGSSHIRQHFLHIYKDLFEEEQVDFPNDLNNLVTSCISEEENQLLSMIPTPEEIKFTLFQMHDLKAPGLDGFLALFYKEFWPTVGDAVTQEVISFFELGSMPKEVNNSLIDLIPKNPNPNSTNHF